MARNGAAAVMDQEREMVDPKALLKTLTAFKKGDFSVRLPVDKTGLSGKICDTLNEIIEMNQKKAEEIKRVCTAVGKEGKTSIRAYVPEAAGEWEGTVNFINDLITDLVKPTSEMARVMKAVAQGELSQRMQLELDGKPLTGEFLITAKTVNTMVDLLNTFSKEVSRVVREVGTEGKLGAQAKVPGITGTWKDLTDSVNSMAANLTNQVRNIAEVTIAVASGDLSKTITVDAKGEILKLKDTINTMVEQLNAFASEVTRVAREVGTEGKLGGQAAVEGVAGTWRDLTSSVNTMAANLTSQVRNIAEVTTAVATGDLTKKITVDVKGEILDMKNTINKMVDQLNTFASEVTRVAREVGTEGKLGVQGQVPGVAGTWRDLTDSVNSMAANLTSQVRNIAEVTTAVATGDLSRKITVDAKGEILQLKDTINTMVEQLRAFASEVTRVAREVGTEGILGGQAQVPGVGGTWKDLTDSVNSMAANLTNQVRNIAEVTMAVASGDLSKKITVDVRGEFLKLKETINTMVDQLNAFASEVTRVAREVGTEGKLGGQAAVEGVSGTWRDLTDSVNLMASNLTNQVRNIAEVTTAVATGDLTKKIIVDVKGEILDMKNTINKMVDLLNTFASEVTRVAREVGTEGMLGGQAQVPGVGGTWKDLTEGVNSMAANLTNQVRNIAEVTTAVASGDLSRKITVDAKGEILQLKDTINTMVEQLRSFASEVTRVAREVGTEGKLGGQAAVEGVSGTWRDLTDSVNMMAANLTGQVRNIAEVTIAVASGDLSKKIAVDVRGEFLQLKDTINTMVDQLRAFASEVTRVAREVGIEGRLGGQAYVPGVAGTWKDLTDNVNMMAANLTSQVRNIAAVTTAVANGDLNRKIIVDVKGEILELKNTINTMVDQLNSFASEVTRVARDVGTEGKLGGQAQVRGVFGVWRDLTDNVNSMATNLTNQVRGIAKVVTAVARGDLKQALTVEARGEIAELADTINNMTDTLATFADQVITVAREVGVEGKLGAQASVPGAAGMWRDLTDNVNRLAANLTNQVRSIAEVATAVTLGDLSRSVTVDAAGEVAILKDNVNQMIRNLRETTRVNTEQDWLKTNLTKFTRILQGQRDTGNVARLILSELAPLINVQHGVFYLNETTEENELMFNLFASYGYLERKHVSSNFRLREGLVGQCAFEKQRILLRDVPGDYVKISSGLGEATPLNIVVLPIIYENEVLCIMELASFEPFKEIHLNFLEQMAESLGIVMNTIAATSRTEQLLKQSQSLATELQTQQEELKQTNLRLEQQARTLQESETRLKEQQEKLQRANEELEEKADLLAVQNKEVEKKSREIELARASLQEKAEQLALTSKYKSEFLANMSHELRTPLNSIIILSKMLTDNIEGNLSETQREHTKTIFNSGSDLMLLINDILDLSKIESGTVELDIVPLHIPDLMESLDRTFRPLAEGKHLYFSIEADPQIPDTIYCDEKRLNQVMKNLLSNSIKFTEKGEVHLSVKAVTEGWSKDHKILNTAGKVIAFKVTDSGIGISRDKHRVIFEAFQQADGTTSRKFGGTGLGLSISREITNHMGGELCLLQSSPGEGSTFVLYLPQRYVDHMEHPRSKFSEVLKFTLPETEEIIPSEMEAPEQAESLKKSREQELPRAVISDDRTRIEADDRVLLIIDEDIPFSRVFLEKAHEKEFKSIIALTGKEGLAMARRYKPDAIVLSVELTDMNGYALLDRLKLNPKTRHIPVYVVSTKGDKKPSLNLGALAHIQKPLDDETLDEALSETISKIKSFVERKTKEVLVVEDDKVSCESIAELIGDANTEITMAATVQEALSSLAGKTFDCMVLDLLLPETSGFDLIEQVKSDPRIAEMPIIIYTGKELSRKEEFSLRKYAESIIVKGARSPERLLSDVNLFLHRVEDELPEPKRRMLEEERRRDPVLSDRNILIVDDDVRNIFAIASALERYQMVISHAETGLEAISILDKNPGIDIVLMDIMMPEMDGYDTMKEIRRIEKFETLPIIALTAKAMKGDRELCIEAGASDYISKPVDMEQLISLLRVWLYQ